MQHQPEKILMRHCARSLNNARQALLNCYEALENRACSEAEGNPTHGAWSASDRSYRRENKHDA